MYDRILFPTDGSDHAESVLEYALRIAAEHEATIHVLNVADTGQDSVSVIRGRVIDALEDEGKDIVAKAAGRARDRGVSVVSEVLQGTPHTTIVDYSDRYDIDCIVMPTHGRSGIHRFLLGSVTERVINTAEIPVITVNRDRDRPRSYPCQHVLVPTDGSQSAALAVREGVEVAKTTGATLHLLHVVETGNLGPDARSILQQDELEARANEILTGATEKSAELSPDAVVTVIKHGTPSREIRRYIDEHEIDLAVMGTHGDTDFSRYVMGSVSTKLVRTAPVPVMWVREVDQHGTTDT